MPRQKRKLVQCFDSSSPLKKPRIAENIDRTIAQLTTQLRDAARSLTLKERQKHFRQSLTRPDGTPTCSKQRLRALGSCTNSRARRIYYAIANDKLAPFTRGERLRVSRSTKTNACSILAKENNDPLQLQAANKVWHLTSGKNNLDIAKHILQFAAPATVYQIAERLVKFRHEKKIQLRCTQGLDELYFDTVLPRAMTILQGDAMELYGPGFGEILDTAAAMDHDEPTYCVCSGDAESDSPSDYESDSTSDFEDSDFEPDAEASDESGSDTSEAPQPAEMPPTEAPQASFWTSYCCVQ
jgi:hypothetical protein